MHRTVSTRLSLACACLAAAWLWQPMASALDSGASDVRAILRQALDRQAGTRSLGRVRMQIRDRTGTRERMLTMRSKRYDDARKTLILIEQPADVRNTGFLSIDYRAGGRTDEQWLYLPKLHRVTRVPNSGKADPFVGSDFSIADLSPQDPERFDARLVEPEVKLGDEACWLIEVTPRDAAARAESGYEKMQIWVSKHKGMTLQLKGWLPNGARTKYFKVSDVKQVNGVWTAHRMQMRTLEGNDVASETVIDVLQVDNDAADVSDADFTQQRLERGV